MLAHRLILTAVGIAGGLTLTPPDYLQGETVRIMYIHVPQRGWEWLAGRGLRLPRSRSSSGGIRSRRSRGGRSLPPGATFAAICLLTGSIWGRPTWGTWWEWDGRLTSMLILFFLYLGYIALAWAERERGGEGRIAALFGLVGAINLPIIHYSVLWWRTLHQGQSIGVSGSSIDSSIVVAVAADDARLHLPVRRGRGDADAGRTRAKPRSRRACAGGCSVNQWAFVSGGLCGRACATAGLLSWSFAAMRRAEAAVDALNRK